MAGTRKTGKPLGRDRRTRHWTSGTSSTRGAVPARLRHVWKWLSAVRRRRIRRIAGIDPGALKGVGVKIEVGVKDETRTPLARQSGDVVLERGRIIRLRRERAPATERLRAVVGKFE